VEKEELPAHMVQVPEAEIKRVSANILLSLVDCFSSDL